MTEDKSNFNLLLRIANVDLDGNKAIYFALKKIKGVSFSFANAICQIAGIDKFKKTGYLDPKEVQTIEDILTNPLKHNIPIWMFNRRKDVETGEDKHLISGDIKFYVQNDIRTMQKIRAYKGFRHAFGLPVRGQRTRGNFRREGALGVSKKKALAAAAPAAAGAKKEGAKK